MEFETYTFQVAGHYASAIINGDYSGLSNRECQNLNQWLERNKVSDKGHWDGFAEEDSLGFCRCDISGLLSDCYELRRMVQS